MSLSQKKMSNLAYAAYRIYVHYVMYTRTQNVRFCFRSHTLKADRLPAPYDAVSNLKILFDVDSDVSFKERSSICNMRYVNQSPPILLHKIAFHLFPLWLKENQFIYSQKHP